MSIAINLLTSHIFPQRDKTKTRHQNVRLAQTIPQEVTGEIHSSKYLAIRKTVNMYRYMTVYDMSHIYSDLVNFNDLVNYISLQVVISNLVKMLQTLNSF